MKKYFPILFLSLIYLNANSQTVSDIRTEQDNSNINIFYKINNSNEKQLYKINISCLVNGKDRIELKSISGDVGDNITGGKSEYKAVWNVLEDVDELTSAEFFVKSELKKDGSTLTIDPGLSNNKWYVSYNAGLIYTQFGVRAGYMKNWGAYVSFRYSPFGYTYSDAFVTDEFGTFLEDSEGYFVPYTGDLAYNYDFDTYSLFSVTAGVSKKILDKKIKLHAYAGAGYGVWGWYDEYEDRYDDTTGEYFNENVWGTDDTGLEIEFGIIGTYKHLSFNAGLTNMIGWYANDIDITIGLGYTF